MVANGKVVRNTRYGDMRSKRRNGYDENKSILHGTNANMNILMKI